MGRSGLATRIVAWNIENLAPRLADLPALAEAARVDSALVSQDLVPRITTAEILDDRAGSDHAPIAVDLNVTTRTSR